MSTTDPKQIWQDVKRIRATLRENPDAAIEMDCFHRDERDQIRAFLTPEQNARITFSWVAPRPTPEGEK